ncbi:MAG: helix-turn-helix domain-containing protein [Clostridia bacterium]|nr:helix-turn-helix domain-containing protein [Clostridia bacterium]
MENYYFHKAVGRRGSESTHHYHENFEIYYLKEGKCRYFIDGSFYEVVAGDIVCIPGGTIHKTNYGIEPHSRMLINFGEEYVTEGLREHINELDFVYRGKEVSIRVSEVFERIEREFTSGDFLSEEALRLLTCELLLVLIRNRKGGEKIKSNHSPVDNVIDYIRENYMHDIKLSEAAKRESVSPEHLSRVFKKTTGFGFNEYLTLLRLQRAEFMLKNEPGKTIGEIAYECGFNDSNYFSYKFKQMYKISPKRARKEDK